MTQMEKLCQTVLAATLRVKLSKVKSSAVLPTFFLLRNFHLVFL